MTASSSMSVLVEVVDRFVDLTVGVLPWLVLGLLAAAAIRVLMPTGVVGRVFAGRHGLGAALVIGALVPGCSRLTAPLAMGLRGAPGQRLGTLTVLVFVAPLLSPITVTLTWSLLGWRMTLARVIAALVGAALLGVLINRGEQWFDAPGRLLPVPGAASGGGGCDAEDCSGASTGRAWPAVRRLIVETLALGRAVVSYFVVGMILAARALGQSVSWCASAMV